MPFHIYTGRSERFSHSVLMFSLPVLLEGVMIKLPFVFSKAILSKLENLFITLRLILKFLLLPPRRTPIKGRGKSLNLSENFLASISNFSAVTRWRAPVVEIIFFPNILSCSGAMIRSKFRCAKVGFWSCIVIVSGLALFIARARATLWRPVETRMSGQGSDSWCFRSCSKGSLFDYLKFCFIIS